ncbi:MAG TPA: hypothetical protein DCY13_21205 [Verrucomicrobiales bacterium]|nr:hypothetical protein [Verrucomicrobiales bacterium]
MGGLPPYLHGVDGGVRLQVKVVPRASHSELGGALGDRLKVRIAAPPVDSAANEELARYLARRLGVNRAAVVIVRGRASRNKTLAIHGLSPEQAALALA